MRESVIEKYLHGCVTAAGGTTRKFVSPGRRGVPDRIVIWPLFPKAAVHFVETKAPKKGPTPQQIREHARLEKMNCTVFVVSTRESVDVYVNLHRRRK